MTNQYRMIAFAVVLSLSLPSYGLRNSDMSGNDIGAQLVYTFDNLPTNGATPATVLSAPDSINSWDLSSSRDGNLSTTADLRIKVSIDPFDLTKMVLNEKPFDNGNGYQRAQKDRSFLRWSASAPWYATATNQMAACASTGITIQAFVRPHFPFQGSSQNDDGSSFGSMIVGFSNSDPGAVPSANAGQNLVAVPNFAIYQIGGGDEGQTRAMARMRLSNGSALTVTSAATSNFRSLTKDENLGAWTEVIASYKPASAGQAAQFGIYLNREQGQLVSPAAAGFLNAPLVMGNELVPLNYNASPDPITGQLDNAQLIKDQRNWSGEIAHVAIYCQGFTANEILGQMDQYRVKAPTILPDNRPITPARTHAQKMASRLTGVIMPIDHPDVLKMETKIVAGDLIGAARVITGDIASNQAGNPHFLNSLVKQMALQMSNREETVRVPLNDFAASFIGVIRDERNAKELLTGNFYYMADPLKVSVPSDLVKDVVETNNHFAALDDLKANWDIGKLLVRREGQKLVVNQSGTLVDHPDPAGVLTSRAFMAAHAIAGTNRRLVEFAFREFMCVPMNEMADTSASKARIGRDVDRLPGRDGTKFENNCKGCHTVMDGFRGAFAKFHFKGVDINSGKVLHADVHGDTNNDYGFDTNLNSGNARSPASLSDLGGARINVVYKMNHNFNVFSGGTYMTTDDSFVNNAVGTKNKPFFGWRGENAKGGFGVGQFGRMLADSKRFSQCMAKRVYEAVCMPGKEYNFERVKDMVYSYANRFEAEHAYNLKKLFQDMAANTACVQP